MNEKKSLLDLLFEKYLVRLMLIITFGLILFFLISPWDMGKIDPYLILGLFAILAAIPMLSRFNIIQWKDMTFSASPKVKEAGPNDKTDDDDEKEKGEEAGRASRQLDWKQKKEQRKKIRNAILDSYGLAHSEYGYKLELSAGDPIADIENLIFDGFYTNWKRHYFIKVLLYSPVPTLGRQTLYRDLRVIKDMTDNTPYRKYIIKIAYVVSEEHKDRRLSGINSLRNYFEKAIDSEYLEIDVFNEQGKKINN